jgi:hypothetical protein
MVDYLRAVPFWLFFDAADKILSKTDVFHRYFQVIYVYWNLYYHYMRLRRWPSDCWGPSSYQQPNIHEIETICEPYKALFIRQLELHLPTSI